jgi:hypothetical protein
LLAFARDAADLSGQELVDRWGMSRFLLNIAKRSLPRLRLRGVGLASKDAVS